MTGYERTLKTLRFETTDTVPVWTGLLASAPFYEDITGKDFWEDPVSRAIEAYKKLPVDMVLSYMNLPYSRTEWRRHTPDHELQAKFKTPQDVLAYIDSLPETETVCKEMRFDEILKKRRQTYTELQDRLAPEIFCMPLCAACRFTYFRVFGYENYFLTMALYPDAVKRLFDHAGALARQINEAWAMLVKEGTVHPYFYTGHDMASSKGPMASPTMLREVYFPSLKYSLEPLVEINAEIIWHSEGYFLPLADDLIDCGVSGFQGFQESCGFDVTEVAAKRVRGGRKPLLMAGLEVHSVLPFGTVDEVKANVRRIIDGVGEGGGLIIGTSGTAGPDSKTDNLKALFTYPQGFPGHNIDSIGWNKGEGVLCVFVSFCGPRMQIPMLSSQAGVRSV